MSGANDGDGDAGYCCCLGAGAGEYGACAGDGAAGT